MWKKTPGFEWPAVTEAEEALICQASDESLVFDNDSEPDVEVRVAEASVRAAHLAFLAGKKAQQADKPQPQARKLTSFEQNLIFEITDQVWEKHKDRIVETQKAKEQAEAAAEQADRDQKADPKFQEVQRILYLPGSEVSAYWQKLGDGDEDRGYQIFEKQWRKTGEGTTKAHDAVWQATEARENAEYVKNAESEKELFAAGEVLGFTLAIRYLGEQFGELGREEIGALLCRLRAQVDRSGEVGTMVPVLVGRYYPDPGDEEGGEDA